jgi:hypothetical protein
VIVVGLARTKSSADSISILPALSGRDAVAISPSGSPVLKKNGAATADTVHTESATIPTANRNALEILDLACMGIGLSACDDD